MGEEEVVSAYWQQKYRREAPKWWNLFYRRNQTRFFKDRHWTQREFPEIQEGMTLLELGCGVGNFILPLVQEVKLRRAWVCDFAPDAIELLERDERFSKDLITAFVADVSQPDALSLITEPVDLVASIFVLSAIPPESLLTVVQNVLKVLRPDGLWIIRDYAVGDAAAGRFSRERKLGENLFVRQDGTLARFFAEEEIKLILNIWFEVECQVIQGRTSNRAKGIDHERLFLQVKARRKI